MMLYIFLILLALTAIYFFFFFIREVEPDIDYFSSTRGKSAFFSFLVLSILIGYATYKEFASEYEISKYIVPYSGNLEAIYTPPIPGNISQVWVFKSTDSPAQIESFYSNDKNRKGWQLIRGFPFMTIRKNKKEIVISVSKQNYTLITYELREAEM